MFDEGASPLQSRSNSYRAAGSTVNVLNGPVVYEELAGVTTTMYEEFEDPQSPGIHTVGGICAHAGEIGGIFGQPVVYAESAVETQSKDVSTL